ncbi:hypothetical protein L21SP2_0875 [Salinispira pacifica]|uniref:Uncharacterized protein n=1 Tax=Salinispira pacifica TaxID=1307761 RepID=V5WF81_9SPIO|nr:hypothetical protein L21SP2_0875 [Salinispira pacifica]
MKRRRNSMVCLPAGLSRSDFDRQNRSRIPVSPRLKDG